MALFRVLVAHESFHQGATVNLVDSPRVEALVRSGFLRPAGPPDPVPVVEQAPKRRGRPRKVEVDHVKGGVESGGGEEVWAA